MNNNRIGRGKQISIYTGKCFRLFKNERQWMMFATTALILIIISLVTSENMFTEYGDTKTGSFAIICACIWVGLFNSIQSICRERDIIKREYRTGLHISSYVLAHGIYEAFLSAVEAAIILVIVWIKNASHLPTSGLILSAAGDIYITFFLTVFGADMIAILISCIVKNESTAMTVMPFVLIIQLVMSGAIFDLKGVTEVISYFTLSRWGMNAMLAVSNTNEEVAMAYELSGDVGCDATAANLAHLWLILLLYAAVYVIIGIIALKQVDKDTR